MENYNGLKKILQYILLYYMDSSDKKKISDHLSKEILVVGKEIVAEFLEWHRLLPLLPPNSEIDNTELRSNVEEKNRCLLDLSKEIIVNFEKEKIDFCFLKGISLVVSLYDDLSLRSFNDIDLFVAKKDLDKVEAIISFMGFKHGYISESCFIPATKSQIKYQRLYTHELFKFVKYHNGMFYPIDINHLFSWVGLDNTNRICLEDIHNNIARSIWENYAFPMLNDVYQFIHLCVHFYNEAIYFALDTSYKGTVPHEIRLFRLFDICFMIMKKNLDAEIIAKNCSKMHNTNKVCFVLTLIDYLFEKLTDLTEFKLYFDLEKFELDNKYYLKDGSEHEWPISIFERIYDISGRKNIVMQI